MTSKSLYVGVTEGKGKHTMPKSWDTGKPIGEVKEEDRGWKLEVDIDEKFEELGMPMRVVGEVEKWFRLKWNGRVAFEAKLESFTVYMPWVSKLVEDLDRLNELLIAEENLKRSFEKIGKTFADSLEGFAAEMRRISAEKGERG